MFREHDAHVLKVQGRAASLPEEAHFKKRNEPFKQLTFLA